jgi:hypothetical protein
MQSRDFHLLRIKEQIEKQQERIQLSYLIPFQDFVWLVLGHGQHIGNIGVHNKNLLPIEAW